MDFVAFNETPASAAVELRHIRTGAHFFFFLFFFTAVTITLKLAAYMEKKNVHNRSCETDKCAFTAAL